MGRNNVVSHNHPNNSGASLADVDSAAWLGAEHMLIVNPDGNGHRHQRIGGEIVELKPLHFPGMDLAGLDRNFAISLESSVVKSSFNFHDLETGQEEPQFDWPEDG